jgi:hypothetical protein
VQGAALKADALEGNISRNHDMATSLTFEYASLASVDHHSEVIILHAICTANGIKHWKDAPTLSPVPPESGRAEICRRA